MATQKKNAGQFVTGEHNVLAGGRKEGEKRKDRSVGSGLLRLARTLVFRLG